MTRVFTRFVGLSCFSLAGLCGVAQFLPAGPDNPATRLLLLAVGLGGIAVGVRWLTMPWPRYSAAVAFVVWADCSLTVGALVMSTAPAQLSSTLYMGLVGVFAAFLLSARILYLHCAWGFLLIVAITGWAALSGAADVRELAPYYMPALTWVVAVPMGGVALIAVGRRAIRATAKSAAYDPLTGLRNRRGITSAVRAALARENGPRTMVVAVCDIDRFKGLNDRHGHGAGDAALVSMAAKLRTLARPGEIVGRIGGDELVLVGFVEWPGDVNRMLERLTPLTRGEIDGIEISASVGVAIMRTGDPHFMFDDVAREADMAMYEAKRAGGGRCVVYDEPVAAAE